MFDGKLAAAGLLIKTFSAKQTIFINTPLRYHGITPHWLLLCMLVCLTA